MHEVLNDCIIKPMYFIICKITRNSWNTLPSAVKDAYLTAALNNTLHSEISSQLFHSLFIFFETS